MTSSTSVTSSNPLTESEEAAGIDGELARQAAAGSRTALETLIGRHQRWVYAIALRMMLNPSDAEDVAQDALVRVLTRIGQFEGRSSFRTWAYRIIVNCFLDARRGRLEQVITGFGQYGEELDRVPNLDLDESTPQRALLVEEAKVGCLLGMLLCLDRDQRIAFVLGDVFECPSTLAAEVLDITPIAFRKRLERARTDLASFMSEKCGLMNPANPCRCEKKTRGFVDAGWVDASRLKFTAERVFRVREDAPNVCRTLDGFSPDSMPWLFRAHPMLEGPDLVARVKQLLDDQGVRDALRLDEN